MKRTKFFEDYHEKGFDYVERKYMSAFTWASHKAMNYFKKIISKCNQFIKFGFVGMSNTLISLAVYYFLLFLGLQYIVAYSVGFCASVCNAYFWNRKYVFKGGQEKNPLKAFVKVFVSYGISFLISIILMSILVECLKVPSVIAPIIKMGITIPFNFILNKFWAFKDSKQKESV